MVAWHANMCSMQQLSLLATGSRAIPDRVGQLERIELGAGAWIDWRSGWLPGSDSWLQELRDHLPWCAAERPMYDRIVAVPRLTAHFSRSNSHSGEPTVHPDLDLLAQRFEVHYGRAFPTVGCNWYRDGNDSVAWHADRVRRPGDSIVAIIGVGQRRPFLLRPSTGGRSTRWLVGDGDLIVLGGTVQAGWHHAVPKVRHAGERISIMIRSAEGTP